MALKKPIKKEPVEYDKNNDIKKLVLFVTIVNHGQAEAVTRIFSNNNCSLQFVQMGQGTAQKQILDILGIADNKKDVVFSIIKKENVEDIKKEVNAFFTVSKRNKGIAFSVPLTSVAGVKAYQFLSNCL